LKGVSGDVGEWVCIFLFGGGDRDVFDRAHRCHATARGTVIPGAKWSRPQFRWGTWGARQANLGLPLKI
jgi:hypothetical protein